LYLAILIIPSHFHSYWKI